MRIQKDLERYVSECTDDQDLRDLCLCLVCLNQLKRVIDQFDKTRLKGAIRCANKRKRHDITAMLRILQQLTILKIS